MNFLYENKEFYVEINNSIMYDSNPYFKIVSQQGLKTKLHYTFKPIFPDFVYENFYLLESEQQQTLISFLEIFLTFTLVKSSTIQQIAHKINMQDNKKCGFNFNNKMAIINFCLEFLSCYPTFCSQFYENYNNDSDRLLLSKNHPFFSTKLRIGIKRRSNFKLTVFYIHINKKNIDQFIHVIKTYCEHLILIFKDKNALIGKKYYFIVSEEKIKRVFLNPELD